MGSVYALWVFRKFSPPILGVQLRKEERETQREVLCARGKRVKPLLVFEMCVGFSCMWCGCFFWWVGVASLPPTKKKACPRHDVLSKLSFFLGVVFVWHRLPLPPFTIVYKSLFLSDFFFIIPKSLVFS